MIPLFDPKWRELKGGYQVNYDPSQALSNLENDFKQTASWEELWNGLHHQGDVGESSYAAVPHLASIARKHSRRDWNVYALLSTIEIERHKKANPSLPDWIVNDYFTAWEDMINVAMEDLKDCNDSLTIKTILGFLALAKKQTKLGALLSFLDDAEVDELVETYYDWTSMYKEQ